MQETVFTKLLLLTKKQSLGIKQRLKKTHFNDEIKARVEGLIRQDYSFEQIEGRCKMKGISIVSKETIYQYIWKDKRQGGVLYKHLRTKGKRYRKRGDSNDKRGLIADRVDISMRPEVVDKKLRIGDLEIDLVIGSDHKGALLTINDRSTGILFMDKIENKEANVVQAKAIELLDDWKPFIHTITSDNGKEFANHKEIAQALDIDYYFAKPYHSWERGANENLNGLVRQYFPKKTNFENINKQGIERVIKILNNRPRKRFGFGYKNPNEILAQKLDEMSE